jgi:hypothetical protein
MSDQIRLLRARDGVCVAAAPIPHPASLAADAASGVIYASSKAWGDAEEAEGMLVTAWRLRSRRADGGGGTAAAASAPEGGAEEGDGLAPTSPATAPATGGGTSGAANGASAAATHMEAWDLVPLHPLALRAAGYGSARPLAVMPAPLSPAGGRGACLIIGELSGPRLKVLSLPDHRLIHEHVLEGVRIIGLAADAAGRSLAVADYASQAVRVIEWPLPGMPD